MTTQQALPDPRQLLQAFEAERGPKVPRRFAVPGQNLP